MGLQTWARRRAGGRFAITDENIPRHLAALGVDWVRPHWMERQLDPRSPAFVPSGDLPLPANLTGRNWTMVGSVGSPREAIVDPRGLVTPWFDGWSLDWWIGADDRWHLPSRETAVRQQLVDAAPVVETAMRVPGGDAVHRAYAVPGAVDLVVAEIENRSPVPFVVALAVRPYNPEGPAVVERIGLVGDIVTVDGRPALLLPKSPPRVAASTFADGDCVQVVTSGAAGTEMPPTLRCDVGLAQAAFLYPLPHTAVLRVAMPLAAQRRTRRRGSVRRRVERLPEPVAALPSAGAVARGWKAQADRGLRLVLPEGRVAEAVEANRRFLLLFHRGPDVTSESFTAHRTRFRDAAHLLRALDRYGFAQEAAEVIAHFPDRQQADGYFFARRQEWDANGAALFAMAEHRRLTGDVSCIDGPTVVAGVQWIERKRRSNRRRDAPALRGLMPASMSAEHLGPLDYSYRDSFWSLRGLLDGAELLGVLGMPEQARQARGWADELRGAVDESLRLVAARLGTTAMPAGPRRRLDPGAVESLVSCWPLGLRTPDDPAVRATLDVVRERYCLGRAFFHGSGHTGLATYLTMQPAFVELGQGDRRALDRLEWLLEAASPTYTWPEAVHPQLGSGCTGDGHHGRAAADFLSFVRELLVRETADGGLALCSMLPDAWLGHAVEVHDAPTYAGRLSFAVRWHGERPALLWELTPHADAAAMGPVRITAPGLDPAWSSTDLRGDALMSQKMPL